MRVVAADYVHRRCKEGERFSSVEELQAAVESVTCAPCFLRVIGESVGLILALCGLLLQSHLRGVFDGREIAQ